MWFNKKTTAVLGCAVVIAAALVAPAAAAVDGAQCTTPEHTSVKVQLSSPEKWAYTYYLTWCVEGGRVAAITPHVTGDADGRTCRWVGSMEETQSPLGDGSGGWNAFNMGEFTCKNGDGTDGSVNPWGVITVWPDGGSAVPGKGVGEVIVE